MLGAGPEPPQAWWWLFPTLGAIGGVLGGLVGSFFSKRGEIAAIQSQISTVVSQNEEIVRSSEAIKTELSERTWSKQQLWDMKRDTALEIMRVYGHILQTSGELFEIRSKYDRLESDGEEREKIVQEYDSMYATKFSVDTASLWQLEEITRLIFTPDVTSKLTAVKVGFLDIARDVADGKKAGPLFDTVRAKQAALGEAIRAELGIPPSKEVGIASRPTVS